MSDVVSASYSHCQQIARRSGSSFFLSFFLLPAEKRRAMTALYAFLRTADDLGDNLRPVTERQQELVDFRECLSVTLSGNPTGPIFPALFDTVRKYEIPHEYLHATLDGVEMDLSKNRYETFADLSEYCYQVASVVGLSCVRIWGVSDKAALQPAAKCGLAFQMVNILRDLSEDAALDRCYLPQQELREFGYSFEQLRAGVVNSAWDSLMQFQIDRVERLFQESRELEPFLARDGRRVFGAMFETYHALLKEIARRPADVLTRRIRVPRWKKWGLAAKWLALRPRLIEANRILLSPNGSKTAESAT
jgi:phytoene synthase